MNKNVFNYLNDKAHDAMDYIRAKAEATGAYLEDHASDIKDGLVKGTATVLTVASLLGGMTGCDTLEQIGGPKLEQYEQLPIRPVEEIEQTGITAEDVLALYDDLAEKCVEAHYATTTLKDELGDRFTELDGQFVSITPMSGYDIQFGTDYAPPYYIPNTEFYLSNSWNVDENSPYYTGEKLFDDGNIYHVKFNLKANLSTASESKFFDFGIPKDSFDTLLETLNTPSIILNKDDLEGTIPGLYISRIDNLGLWGQKAYETTPINRETIANATPEQLWALYNLISDMINLNFNATIPSQNLDENTLN